MVLARKGLPERRSASFIKVNGQMLSTAFKRRPAFSFTVTITTSFLVHEIPRKFHIKDIEYSDLVIYESLTISYTAHLFI